MEVDHHPPVEGKRFKYRLAFKYYSRFIEATLMTLGFLHYRLKNGNLTLDLKKSNFYGLV